MHSRESTARALTEHCRAYPLLRVQDIFKFIYQSSFGCEHLVTSEETATEYIRKEYAERESEKASSTADGAAVPLDGEYVRAPLSLIGEGLMPETLGRLFCLSAKKEENGLAALNEKLSVAIALAECGELPFSVAELKKEIKFWKENGFPAVHHSDVFRRCYTPSYRVIAKRYADFLSVFTLIDRTVKEHDRVIIAIEGGSASGKSTLGEMLKEVYSCNLFHMDDFFLRPEQRTAERFAEVGGNVDRERFYGEVLLPLSQNREIAYRRYDCGEQRILPAVKVKPCRLNVVEGAYSMHPLLSPLYTASVFLDVDPTCQRERIKKRNTPSFAERFFNEWIPLETKYFTEMTVKERCDLVIGVG